MSQELSSRLKSALSGRKSVGPEDGPGRFASDGGTVKFVGYEPGELRAAFLGKALTMAGVPLATASEAVQQVLDQKSVVVTIPRGRAWLIANATSYGVIVDGAPAAKTVMKVPAAPPKRKQAAKHKASLAPSR